MFPLRLRMPNIVVPGNFNPNILPPVFGYQFVQHFKPGLLLN